MDEHGATELSELVETYARQVAGFDQFLNTIRGIPLGDAPLTLDSEGRWPREH